ncbi:SET domain-containing protein 9-like isoform X2 [Palaemon carinicauda]|uniref:SET domain-containing protein 9-like isoform X2 n=1 Tax=Palaemon carinicauda TaxID=392227 RepID=UPI0035B6A24E
MLDKLSQVWHSYKYRFVPWLAFNLKERTVRSVKADNMDKIISDECLLDQLTTLTASLRGTLFHVMECPPGQREMAHRKALKVMEDVFGFHVIRAPSVVGGTGVIVVGPSNSKGSVRAVVKKGQVVGLYPGVIYLPMQPIFFQSIGNPFIFRCADGILIDGHDRRISKSLFRSCVNRDRVGTFTIADTSWLTEYPLNPLNVGQYVNNQSKGYPSNVAYQELTVDGRHIPLQERCFIPNLWYSPPEGVPVGDIPVRLVALVATRDIGCGEELFSDYFTIIR